MRAASCAEVQRAVQAHHRPAACQPPHDEAPISHAKPGDLKNAQFFANIDMFRGYWKFLLAGSTQVSHSFITLEGIFTPTCSLLGTTNVATHLQSYLTDILPSELHACTLIWLDDILLHAPTVGQVLLSIRSFFARCTELNIKLHPAKCILFTKEVHQ